MPAEGFLSRRERHPVALTIAVALNLGGVTALMLARGDMPMPRAWVIPTILIPPEPPKAEPVQPVPPRSRPAVARPAPRPAETTPVAPPPAGTTSLAGDPTPMTSGTGDAALGSGGVPAQPDPPVPVFSEAAVDPRYAAQLQPPYPPQLERLSVEGRVVIEVRIGTDGRVKAARILFADDEDFARVTERQALTRWRFRPATRDAMPVESVKRLTVRFQLRRG
ncbi:TonB family protein [Sphingomonas changnyeongensis]|uniref:Protein TonB n=1 Tax=Sphingomonas changnyeongensis TaxID=2698679 RepID=A0A7Z2NW86_9SPHN|nr:energy transducer TonB [Sphingomonas changnyeongensis]QHL90596.1 TonB family protein [Sphingomonas changnyeongensis]